MMRRTGFTTTRALSVATVLLMAAPPLGLTAQSQDELRKTTPPNPGAVTDVAIDLSDVQIIAIDPQQQTYEVEGYINARWYDTRHVNSIPRRLYQDEAATEILKTMWWPYFEIADSRGPRTTIHRTVAIDFDGEVFYEERFSAQVKQDLNFEAFPFDTTVISFTVVPFAAGSDVRFVAYQPDATQPDTTTKRAAWEPSEWIATVQPLVIDSGTGAWPSATARIHVERVPDSYVLGILVPLAVIVLITSSVFWMNLDGTHLGDRLGVSFTALLTVVAFDFVTSDSLPKLWYLTIMDRILIGTYVVMALVIVQNVAACVLYAREIPKLALSVDRVSRVLFPVGYLIFLWWLIPT